MPAIQLEELFPLCRGENARGCHAASSITVQMQLVPFRANTLVKRRKKSGAFVRLVQAKPPKMLKLFNVRNVSLIQLK